jgi:hypothetical protein
VSAYRSSKAAPARATMRRRPPPRTWVAPGARKPRRDSDAVLVTALTIAATVISLYDLCILALSA